MQNQVDHEPTEMTTITKAEADRMRANGHVVHVMPRKRLVRVDGFKMFRLAA